MTEEQYCRQRIAILQESYRKAIKPYVDRLVEIECMKPQAPIIFDAADLPESVRESVMEWMKNQAR